MKIVKIAGPYDVFVISVNKMVARLNEQVIGIGQFLKSKELNQMQHLSENDANELSVMYEELSKQAQEIKNKSEIIKQVLESHKKTAKNKKLIK